LREPEADIGPTVCVPQQRYNELVQQAIGFLAASEESTRLRDEIRALYERIGRLEASAASGWTESRQSIEQTKMLREELGNVRASLRASADKAAREEADRQHLQKELDARTRELDQANGVRDAHRSSLVAQMSRLDDAIAMLSEIRRSLLDTGGPCRPSAVS
jgi:hypothetical protein